MKDNAKLRKGEIVAFLDIASPRVPEKSMHEDMPGVYPARDTLGIVVGPVCPNVKWLDGKIEASERYLYDRAWIRRATLFEKLRYRIFGK